MLIVVEDSVYMMAKNKAERVEVINGIAWPHKTFVQCPNVYWRKKGIVLSKH